MVRNNIKFIKQFFNKYYWRQHPEAALRYIPVVEIIKKSGLENSSILEVGSGSLGIIPYLKREIDGIDIDFSGPQTHLMKKIKGQATSLPFKKNAYEVVISVDVIEHIPQDHRSDAIAETLRVAKKLAIIVVPIGKKSEEQDKKLREYWNRTFTKPNQFLEEHTANGLPTTDSLLIEIDKNIRKLKKETKVSSRPLLNLFVRNILMRTWITKSKILYYLYMKGYLLLLPVLKHANFGDCYRRLIVIEFQRPHSMNREASKFIQSEDRRDNSEKVKGKLGGEGS